MKILILKSDKSDIDPYFKHLVEWGYEVIFCNKNSSIISHLKKTHKIQLLFICERLLQVNNLIKTVRNLQQYIFIIYVREEGSKTPVENFPSGIDYHIDKAIDPLSLRNQLHSIQQMINFSLNMFSGGSTPEMALRRQILNLEQAQKQENKNRRKIKKALEAFIEEAEKIQINDVTIKCYNFDKMIQTADKIGAEQLLYNFVSLLYLKNNPIVWNLLNYNLLQHLYRENIRNLSTAVQCLDSFFFFSEKSNEETADPLENKRVLLVEDMKYNRVLLKKILEKHKCDIVEAVNGEDAVEKWQKEKNFDLIIMDMNMPVMDGFTATHKIRELEAEGSRTPIIALTALAMRGDREQCLEAGTDDYLPKPVEAVSLVRVCKRLLTNRELPSPAKDDQMPVLKIRRVLLKSNNHIYRYVLMAAFEYLGIEFKYHNDESKVLEEVVAEEFDLIVLEAERDLELAYFIKNNFLFQNIILILEQNYQFGLLHRKIGNNLIYPFDLKQVKTILNHYSDKLQQAKRDAEKLADIDSLSKIKGQAGISAAVEKSNHQLAVWQKAFRKIGGDLVLSHQFNLHGKFGFILGDVAGHDIQSGYTASWFSGLIEGIWGQNNDPFNLLINLNNLFPHDAEEENKRFVCALVLLWDPLRSKLLYANAGIPGGILIKKNATKAKMIEWTGVPIGMFPEMDMFDHGEVDFLPGDRLIMATDGVLEAIPREIISGLGESKSDQPPQHVLDTIVDFVTRSIEVTDDLTIAVFEAKTPPEPVKGYRQSISSDFKSVDGAVAKMDAFINENTDDLFDWPLISVAIREALINAVEHGNKNHTEFPVDIDFELKDDLLRVTISDCGSGFDLSSEKKRLEKEGDLRIHGRGIEMMENIGRSVHYQGGGILLEFIKKT